MTRAMTIVTASCSVSTAFPMWTVWPFSSNGNERDVGPQISAARFSRISATPSVLTSHAKLNRSNASTGRTAMK